MEFPSWDHKDDPSCSIPLDLASNKQITQAIKQTINQAPRNLPIGFCISHFGCSWQWFFYLASLGSLAQEHTNQKVPQWNRKNGQEWV